MNSFDLNRFVKAQGTSNGYATALSEVRNGHKVSHWIWYIFPQLAVLGRSSCAKYYGIGSLQEAKAYLAHEVLSARLYEITRALLEQQGTAVGIFGGVDALKVRSCMTLFDRVSPGDVFGQVLDRFYLGKRCGQTLAAMEAEE